MEFQDWVDALKESPSNRRIDVLYDLHIALYPESTPDKNQIKVLAKSLGASKYLERIWMLKEYGFGSMQMGDK